MVHSSFEKRPNTQESSKDRSSETKRLLSIHDDERLPVYEEVELAFAIPVFCELLNGNISHILETLSGITIPKEKFAAIFVINNPRIYAMLADYEHEIDHGKYEDAIQKIEMAIGAEDTSISQFEKNILQTLKDLASIQQDPDLVQMKKRKIKNIIRSYRENSVTLRLLQLAQQISHLKEKANTGSEALLLEQMQQIWQRFSSSKELPEGLMLAMRRGIQFAVINSCDSNKGYISRNVGTAKKEAITLAFDQVCPGAKYVHIQDADSSWREDSLVQVFNELQDKTPDAFIVQMYLNTRISPDQLKQVDVRNRFKFMMYFYVTALEEVFEKYANNKLPYFGPSVIISRKLYETVPYPEEEINGDILFGDTFSDPEYQLDIHESTNPNVVLDLAHRGREDSYDGASVFRVTQSEIHKETVEETRDRLNKHSAYQASEWCEEALRLLHNPYEDPALIRKFWELSDLYSQRIQLDRKVFLKFAKQLISQIPQFVTTQTAQDAEIGTFIEKQPLKTRQFLFSNKIILETLLDELRIRGLERTEQIEQFCRKFLPEYFLFNEAVSDINSLEEHANYLRRNGAFLSGYTIRDFIYLPLVLHAVKKEA